MNPYKMLLIYNNTADSDSSYYVEYANMIPTTNGNYKPHLFYPLTKKKVFEFKRIFNSIKTTNEENKVIANYFNRHVIYHDDFNLVWKVPASRRKLVQSTGLVVDMFFPEAIFKYKHDKLSIVAYDEYRGLETEIFYIKLPNISSSSVCLGNNKIPNYNSYEELMTHIENIFFNSPFTGEINKKNISYKGIFNEKNKHPKTLKEWI